MGYIKEPEGVDFVIKSPPLTEEDRAEISDFIRKHKKKQTARKPTGKRKSTVENPDL